MQLRRVDDYQSWALEIGARRVLIDPWLSGALVRGAADWVFGRTRPDPALAPGRVDGLVLTAHFADHLHRPTLARLPKSTPVFASHHAARTARGLGFTDVTALRDGQRADLGDELELEAIAPDFPYSHNSLGYVFSHGGRRVYLETHVVNRKRGLERAHGVDVLVAPVQSVRVAGVVFVMSAERAVETARLLQPKTWVATGVDPQHGHGLLQRTLVSCRGTVDDFAARLKEAGLPTTFAQPAPGEAIAVGDLVHAPAAVGT